MALPPVFGIGLLCVWERSYRLENPGAMRLILWNLGITLALALAIAGAALLSRRIRAEWWLTALALLLMAAGMPAALRRGLRETAPPHPRSDHAIHRILFLSIDTLRFDAVSALRPEAPPTPALDSLASDSVIFTRAYSPAPWTLPAFSSMMTGVTPLVHGVRKFEDRIPAALPTLAERMSRAGYTTAAFGDQLFLHPQHGIARGFDSWQLSPRDDYGFSLGAKLLGRASPVPYKTVLDTTAITDLTLDWVRQHARDDFFLWVHYFKPHGPYEPLARYRPREKPPEGMGYSFGADNAIRSGSVVITAAQRPWVRQLYEGELRYVDDNVGRLLAEMKSLGLYDDTLIVFASDHGEEFWDHGARAHGHTFYDELLHVPLWVKLPRQARQERREELVCTGSITPTVLELAGVSHVAQDLSYASLPSLMGGAGEPYREVPVLSASPLYYEDRESIVSDDTKYGIQSESSAPLSPETLERLRSLGYVH
jgi:arylsulfatase A-like enzyme